MTVIPHFDLPFRFQTDAAVTVEQDTLDDVYNCVFASLLHHYGQRPEAPTFGAGDLTFGQQPLDLQAIIEKVLADEPRASLLLSQSPAVIDEMIALIEVRVSVKEG